MTRLRAICPRCLCNDDTHLLDESPAGDIYSCDRCADTFVLSPPLAEPDPMIGLGQVTVSRGTLMTLGAAMCLLMVLVLILLAAVPGPKP